uniref:Kunitz/Bovine pancreatic trypsin inhibitor domain protein n=1 Tax=Caenorhabditis tropicalis TaxID=1561998 RepID=A0A1I7V371_9PELO
MLPLRWIILILCAIVAVRSADDSLINSFKTMFFGTEPEKAGNDTATPQNNPPISYHQYSASSTSSSNRSQPPSGQSCTLPRQIGTGPYRIPRWYYNPVRGRCELFYWSGCCGNGNNFQTFQSCQSTCEDSSVLPSRYRYRYRSSPTSSSSSPQSSHILLSTPQFSVLQPASTQIDVLFKPNLLNHYLSLPPVLCPCCLRPFSEGYGSSKLIKFYYDAPSKQCRQFIYRGMGGYGNQFENEQKCLTSCGVSANIQPTLETSSPALRIFTPLPTTSTAFPPIVQFSTESPNPCAVSSGNNLSPCAPGQGCGTGSYCHVGAQTQTTVCCPKPAAIDKCHQPLNIGVGNANLQRWYFNPLTQQCQTCNYRGLQGNENNFLSQNECEQSCLINPCKIGSPFRSQGITVQCSVSNPTVCPAGYYCHLGADAATSVCCQALVWINACPSGEPYLLPNGKPQPCDSIDTNSCPLTHWCHPGPDASTTMCCPGKVDPCTQVLAQGEGPLSVTRYYFNVQSRTCDEFMFRGLKGNSNNFISLSQCEKVCPVQHNPCPITMSSLKHSAKLIPCSATKSCPTQQWCHYGETKETTVCCPNAVDDPCTAPARNPGVGEFHATRWAFESSSRKCVPFEYRGMKGNSNNFLTRENCEKRCPVFQNPCKIGDPHIVDNRYLQCSPQQVCPGGYYCHIGVEANYCCKALGGDPCGQPLDRGLGGSQLSRWYWNQQSQCCLPFSYCGQKGTQNNFLTKQDCDRTCYVEPPQTCQQPMVVGSGGASLPRWYYDASTMTCISFNYQGRMGNQNNFLSQQACEQTCPVYVNVCPTGSPMLDPSTNKPVPCTFGSNSCGSDHWCHLGLVPDEYQCCPGSPTNPGACQGMPPSEGVLGAPSSPTSRWYYDQTDMQCKQFTYNGRQGNQNNFLTLEDCAAVCDVFTNPCNQPISLPATLCSGSGSSDTCGTNMWCHIGATQDSTVCCPSEGDPCSLPLARGSGNQFMDRFYYNQQTGSCQQFTYSGLHGNQNNFLTQQTCEEQCGPNPCFEGRPFVGADGRTQTCSASANFNTCPLNHWCHIGSDLSTTACCPGASTNVCNLPMSTGEGNARLDRFYYDQQTKTCRPFVYNGLKGNQNNFISLRACQLSCQPLDNPCIGQPATTAAGQVLFCSISNKDSCPVNFWCHIGATPETTVCCPGATNPCSVPLAPGTGNSGLARYYYNPDDRVNTTEFPN